MKNQARQGAARRPRARMFRAGGTLILLVALGGAFSAAPGAQAAAAKAQPKTSRPGKISPQAKALLDHTMQALGGAAFLGFKTMSSHGRIFVISEGDTAGYAPFQSKMLYPDKRRFSYGKDKPVIVINNGNQGWEIDRYGLIPLEQERIHRWEVANRYDMVNLLRVVAREPGTLILTAGVDFVNNQPVNVLEIVDTKGVDLKLYLERSTYLPVRITYRTREKPDQDWTEVGEDYSDYQTIQGIQTPMHMTRYEDGSRVLEVFRNSATYNEEYAPDTFRP